MSLDAEDQNEIECPRCGERVYIEVLVCPNCGLHFYANEADPLEEQAGRSGWLGALLAVLLGAFAAGAASFALHLFAAALWADPYQAAGGQALLWLAAPLGGLVGGYLAASLVKERAWQIGLLTGVLALAPAYLLEAYYRDLSTQPPGGLAVSSWLAMVVCGGLGGWAWRWLADHARQ